MTFLGSSPSPVERSDDQRHPEGVAALERIEVELSGVEHALARLDAGTYGRCEVCNQPIDDDLLAADPTATVCSGHLAVLGGNVAPVSVGDDPPSTSPSATSASS